MPRIRTIKTVLLNRAALFFLVLLGCKDPFFPDTRLTQTNFLVVEGFISVGPDAVTTIRLSRTIPLSDASAEPSRESGAAVAIEDNLENVYTLTEQEPGIYRSDTLTLPVDRTYRLAITTDDESRYVSDFTTPVVTPPIDSLSWKPFPEREPFEGMEIYVSTHDPENKTLYYQWNYREVWERRSISASTHKYENGKLVLRASNEVNNMRTCYERATENRLLVESVAKLQTSNVFRKLLSFPSNDIRIHRKYGITVTQTALSQQTFDYLQVMERNSNALGGFFDPQPSQLLGNIRKSGSSEPVIGFVAACQPAIATLMIRASDAPWWGYNYPCNIIQVSMHPDSLMKYLGSYVNTPLTLDQTPPEPSFVFVTDRLCADCRLWGGDNDKPDYWD